MEPVIEYLDMNAIGDLFGVDRATVTKWRRRYEHSHPTPEPDAMIGPSPGWLPERKAEWLEWRKTLPGQLSGLKRGRSERKKA